MTRRSSCGSGIEWPSRVACHARSASRCGGTDIDGRGPRSRGSASAAALLRPLASAAAKTRVLNKVIYATLQAALLPARIEYPMNRREHSRSGHRTVAERPLVFRGADSLLAPHGGSSPFV